MLGVNSRHGSICDQEKDLHTCLAEQVFKILPANSIRELDWAKLTTNNLDDRIRDNQDTNIIDKDLTASTSGRRRSSVTTGESASSTRWPFIAAATSRGPCKPWFGLTVLNQEMVSEFRIIMFDCLRQADILE